MKPYFVTLEVLDENGVYDGEATIRIDRVLSVVRRGEVVHVVIENHNYVEHRRISHSSYLQLLDELAIWGAG